MERDKTGRISERQRPQEYGIHHAEDGSVRPDAKRKSKNCDRRKTRIAAELAEAVADVLGCVFQPAQPVSIAAFLFLLLHAAKGPERRISGFFRRHSCRDVLLRLQLDVELQFLIQIALQPAASNDGCNPA